MGDATPLSLPPDLPYPITVTRLLVKGGQSVSRGDTLLEYSFLSASRNKENLQMEKDGKTVGPERWKNDMVGSWESPVDGTTSEWKDGVQPGLVIARRQANKSLISVEQACTHPVQIHGMCGVCGADITNDDYLSRPADTSNPSGPAETADSFELAHDALGVKVSTNEARRLEDLSRKSLLESRRLSLIVDLDQTIIHTTVDPTITEWLAEIEEDEKEAAEEKAKGKEGEETRDAETEKTGDARSTTPPSSPPRKREKNPNAEALRDVAPFRLADDVPPGYRLGGRAPPRRLYYTKPRPGLHDFLTNMSKKYEMHVYTMGTRSYADEICKIIDPEGKFFGGRILSRDESGSMSSKSLVRLFPTDQTMVVIIDDRSDVWGDSPNLLKVVPYDFFVGIGDINGAFLPPPKPVVTPVPGADPSTPSTAPSSPGPETPPQIPSTEEGLLLQSKLLDELAQKRPLAQLEHESECDDEDEENAADGEAQPGEAGAEETNAKAKTDSDSDDKAAVEDKEAEEKKAETGMEGTKAEQPPPQAAAVQHQHHHHHRKQLLNPEDHELHRVSLILTEVHDMFYKAYDSRDRDSDRMPLQCDAPLLLQEIKDEVLAGCTIAFTGVMGGKTTPANCEIWQQAETFGAICVTELNEKVTHLVVAKPGTDKVYRASKMVAKTGIKIVWIMWLQSSIALWRREPEERFLVFPASAPPPPVAPPSRPESVDADGDVKMEDDTKEGEDGEANGDDAADGDFYNAAAWDDDAQAELDEFLAEHSDEDDSDSSDEPPRRSRAGTPSVWSRAATPGPSILSRAGSPSGSRAGSPGPDSKHVRYADEENLPLEDVREPQPGDIPSYPPRKKPRLLVAPSPDDDIPEANKMTYNAPSLPASQESTTSTDDEDDEFARMLQESLADG